ncbi:hypothetical protein [Coleofasciculus sp. G2-EDA-02]|uniref:hypothetical protein n=1 Tax=Coleofasciculus sp. G2-EDA-02 TaxID=3069529 RepID=UPI00406354DE
MVTKPLLKWVFLFQSLIGIIEEFDPDARFTATATTGKFQSLIGIIEDFDLSLLSMARVEPRFQSLIGIIEDFDLPTSETLAVFSFQGSMATTSSKYSISALGFDNPSTTKTPQILSE